MDSAEKKESGVRCSMELMRCECSLIYEYDMSQVCIGYQIRSFVMVGVRLLCDNDGCDIMCDIGMLPSTTVSPKRSRG
jgi:hypothetical protein